MHCARLPRSLPGPGRGGRPSAVICAFYTVKYKISAFLPAPVTPGPGRQAVCVSLGLLTQYLSPAVTAAIVLALALLVMDWSAPPPRATGPVKHGMNWSNMTSKGRAGQKERVVCAAPVVRPAKVRHRSNQGAAGRARHDAVQQTMPWPD